MCIEDFPFIQQEEFTYANNESKNNNSLMLLNNFTNINSINFVIEDDRFYSLSDFGTTTGGPMVNEDIKMPIQNSENINGLVSLHELNFSENQYLASINDQSGFPLSLDYPVALPSTLGYNAPTPHSIESSPSGNTIKMKKNMNLFSSTSISGNYMNNSYSDNQSIASSNCSSTSNDIFDYNSHYNGNKTNATEFSPYDINDDTKQLLPISNFDELTFNKSFKYVKQPRQNRFNNNATGNSTSTGALLTKTKKPKVILSVVDKEDIGSQSNATESYDLENQNNKKISDSRLSAHGLAEVLLLDSPEEALKRERYILDIFENELHYPLGYKTWVRDTSKDQRVDLISKLHSMVKEKHPEYDYDFATLETIIRRATYYMMQSRLRRERRARAKSLKANKNASVN